MCGDKQLKNVVSHTDIEREGLIRLMNDGSWHDVVRAYFGAAEVLYSWWSYRARDWAASNRGRRLDHVWTSLDLADSVSDVQIHSDLRGAEKPSDHVPTVITIADAFGNHPAALFFALHLAYRLAMINF